MRGGHDTILSPEKQPQDRKNPRQHAQLLTFNLLQPAAIRVTKPGVKCFSLKFIYATMKNGFTKTSRLSIRERKCVDADC